MPSSADVLPGLRLRPTLGSSPSVFDDDSTDELRFKSCGRHASPPGEPSERDGKSERSGWPEAMHTLAPRAVACSRQGHQAKVCQRQRGTRRSGCPRRKRIKMTGKGSSTPANGSDMMRSRWQMANPKHAAAQTPSPTRTPHRHCPLLQLFCAPARAAPLNFFYNQCIHENAAMLKFVFFGLLSSSPPHPCPPSRRGVRPTRVTRRAADTRNMRDRNLAKA